MTRPLVMGILNVTPDSFSDGGRWFGLDAALTHARELAEAGAELIDVGGESTRPGSTRPTETEELERVVPVVAELARAGMRVSVDTMRASVAAASLDAGAEIINDVSAGLADPAMVPLVAQTGCTYIAMHWRGHGDVMDSYAHYDDVVAEVLAELQARIDALVEAGARPERLILDPGLGFAKNAEQNWQLMAHLDVFTSMPHRVLVGSSRKRFLGTLGGAAEPVPPTARDAATAATSLLAAQAGAWAVRVHDVPSTLAALQVHEAVEAARAGAASNREGDR